MSEPKNIIKNLLERDLTFSNGLFVQVALARRHKLRTKLHFTRKTGLSTITEGYEELHKLFPEIVTSPELTRQQMQDLALALSPKET